MTKLILPTLLSILMLMPQLAAAPATGTVNGTVVDAAEKPATNLKVRLRKVVSTGPIGRAADATAGATVVTTDKEGKFSQALEPGDYWAEAGSKTLGYVKDRFEVKAGETTELKLSLAKDAAN